MPVTIRVDAARCRVEIVASGVLTGEEVDAAQKEIMRSPGFKPSFDALFDLAAVSDVEISTEKVRAVSDKTAFAPEVRRAFVTSNPAMYGMMRMFGSFLGDRGGEIEMFQDRLTAERWLDRE